MLKPEDINGKVWDNSGIIIGAEKIKFDGFIFDKATVENNPILTMMLLICADPTEKQKELLDLIGVVLEDDNRKKFYPCDIVIDLDKKEELLVE
ncbi:hypothetical protein KAU11_09390 [Candidatus Babeliales bacterium]|nr:hypothetical protein [Candidatus Babeliales bacterium]